MASFFKGVNDEFCKVQLDGGEVPAASFLSAVHSFLPMFGDSNVEFIFTAKIGWE
jgi:hypothetical protein